MSELSHQEPPKSGKSWIYEATNFIYQVEQDKMFELVKSLPEKAIDTKQKIWKLINSIHKDTNTEDKTESQAFENLFLNISLQLFIDHEESILLLEDLENCYIETKNVKNKTKKSKEETDKPNPIEVLTEIMLSLLIKPSSLLRELVSQCFKIFCHKLTQNALESLLNVIVSNTDDSMDIVDLEDIEDNDTKDDDDDGDEDSKETSEDSEEMRIKLKEMKKKERIEKKEETSRQG